MSVSVAGEDFETVQLKFHAALNVIKNLPKNGSYKPTPKMMLKFYSYYKQSTEGPCTKPKPWAWDVINKAKWDAWSKLGDMSKKRAMEEYVESLKLVMTEAPPVSDEQIVEAMPATDNVQAFIKVLGTFYEAVDLEPPSQFKKFGNDTTSTPLGNGTLHNAVDEVSQLDTTSSLSVEQQCLSNNAATMDKEHSASEPADQILEDHQADSGESEDEFCDTAEEIQVCQTLKMTHYQAGRGTSNGKNSQTPTTFLSGSLIQSVTGGGGNDPPHSNMQVKNQIAASLAQLQQDMDKALDRLSVLEARTVLREDRHNSISGRDQHGFHKIWPFTELSPKTVFFILSWPFAVVWFLDAFHRRRLKK